jgi:hypothetical protein
MYFVFNFNVAEYYCIYNRNIHWGSTFEEDLDVFMPKKNPVQSL